MVIVENEEESMKEYFKENTVACPSCQSDMTLVNYKVNQLLISACNGEPRSVGYKADFRYVCTNRRCEGIFESSKTIHYK